MVREFIDLKTKEGQVFEKILNTCLSLDPDQDMSKLGATRTNVSRLSESLHEQVDTFKQKLAEVPLFTFIVLWGEMTLEDKKFGIQHLKSMHDLIESKVLPLSLLEKFTKLDPSAILEKIRAFPDWSINKREEVALLYLSFISWLSKETFGFVPEAVDLDRIASQKRQVPFETYINILDHLDLRERILAKMFYLGGNRGLEEVLSVKVEDVDFKKRRIRLDEEVSYPRHLFDDIEDYIEGRKKGYVFMGRDGERISHTTSFRALKKVVSDLKLDPEFTFRELTKNN